MGGRGYASGDVWPVGESSGYGNKDDTHSDDGGNGGVGGDNAWNDSEGSGGDKVATKGAMAVSEVEAETEMKTQAMAEMETAKSEGDGSEDNNGGGGRQRWLRWLPRRRRH